MYVRVYAKSSNPGARLTGVMELKNVFERERGREKSFG